MVFSQKTRAPAWNADPRRTTFFQVVFSQKTKAPARNADPRRIACVSHLSSRRHGGRKKMFTLLGPNCHPGGQICCGADFGSRNKISGHPLGQSASFFEIYPFRLVLEPKSPSCYGPWPCPASWSNGHAGCYGEPARAITDGTVAAGTGGHDIRKGDWQRRLTKMRCNRGCQRYHHILWQHGLE